MKYFFLILLFAGCQGSANTIPEKDTPIAKKDTVTITKTVTSYTNRKPLRPGRAKYYTTTDPVIVYIDNYDTSYYSKKEFNEIVDLFPSLYNDIPANPDLSFAASGSWADTVDAKGELKHISFSSEAGQDAYYVLYAYFLKRKNEGSELVKRRKVLFNILEEINQVFRIVEGGGTFFGHQSMRIIGYTEYGVYQYRGYAHINSFSTDEQVLKKLYIASLKQVIITHLNSMSDLSPEEREKKRSIVFKSVEKIASLITDNFYLEKAQEFQYSHY
jgi:hypothetical protein